jgi:hypothetical protein
VHGSWTTSFVQGHHDYVVPLLPDRGPDGRGRARTWDWPVNVREVPTEELADVPVDVVLLQRPHEPELLHRWTGLRAGVDVASVYVEHNAPPGPAAATRHPLADQDAITVVHVTSFNALMWDCGRAPTAVVEHGVVDPGYRYTGEIESLAVVVNEPVRRWRVAGTDLVLQMSGTVPVAVYGMGLDALVRRAPQLAGSVHDLRQDELHDRIGHHRGYFHPYRWTSLGLALIEAMTAGLPVLGLPATAAPEAVPETAGVLSSDLDVLRRTARRWMHEPEEARERGWAGRRFALERFGLHRFLDDWDVLLKEVTR